MSENEAKVADAKAWAVGSALQLSAAMADIAHALASPRHLVVRGYLRHTRDQMREAEENLTRALINLESIENG